VRAEQFIGGHRDFRVGASIQSVVDPIESWNLNKVEASLASFVLHQDYRDYFEREGWSGYLKFTPRATGVTAQVEYRDEKHRSQAARDPWTIFDNSENWRLQPMVAEGNLRSLNGLLEIDRRDDDDFATSGFFLRGELTHALGGNLRHPVMELQPAGIPDAYTTDFTTGLIDARVYRRVGYNSTLSFRFLGAGAITDAPLPPQFQHALGGAGSLPGFSAFSADCGARRSAVSTGDDQLFFPYYGCDRTALFSAEYRGGFDLHFGGLDVWDDEDDWDWDVDAHPNWVLFFDAARGWAHDAAKARGAIDTETLYDVGAGILLGDFGIYGAVPLTGDDRALRFFVRLGARF
jgi:outer membrane protein assembly factor BamA